MSWKRWLTLAAIVIASIAAIAVFRELQRFVAVDSCLDAGGRWDDEGARCEGGPS